MPKLRLYKTDPSPPARAVLMVIEYLGLEVDTVEVAPLNGDTKKPEYLELNPLHTVPFLEDGNFKLPDSHAIITYLVSKYGGKHRSILFPADVETRATIHARLYFDAGTIFPKIIAISRSLVLEKATEVIEELVSEVKEAYGFLENYLGKSEFLAANHVTLADISLVSSISTLNVVVPLGEEYPKLMSWLNNLQKEEWYKTGNAPGLATIEAIFSSLQSSNVM